jgi:hypothetical protein
MIYQMHTELSLRHIFDGITREKFDGKKVGAYICLDLTISTNAANHEQRDVRIGVHLLRFGENILGFMDDNFFGRRDYDNMDWERISTHNSCWMDSTMGWMRDAVRDVMENQDKSKYTEKYADDELSYDPDNYDDSVWLATLKVLTMDDIKGVVFTERRTDDPYKQKLIREVRS